MSIERTYILNLRTKPKRKEHALSVTKRLPCVEVLEASLPQDSAHIGHPSLSGPEKACFHSHIRAWKKFRADAKGGWALVLEDEAVPLICGDTLLQMLRLVAKRAPAWVDFVNLGGKMRPRSQRGQAVSVRPGVFLVPGDASLYHAYLIRHRAVPRWVKAASRAGPGKPVDKLHQKAELKTRYAVLHIPKRNVLPTFSVAAPPGSESLKVTMGIFAQARGGVFASSIEQARKARRKAHKNGGG
jgi:hypothetical protein